MTRATGKLRSWHDERGFGFIAPTGGGRELFVHISAFPRDGSRPTVGETLSYESAPGKDGQLQALRVTRQALGDPAAYLAPRRPAAAPRGAARQREGGSWWVRLIVAALLVGLGAYGYSAYQRALRSPEPRLPVAELPETEAFDSAQPAQNFRCDGRTHCSQMSSCAEARFFLANCPGVKMDGNGDGVPCEQQHCGG